MVCKLCNKDKIREMTLKGGQYVYVSDGKQWHGKVCPDCTAAEKRARRGSEVRTASCVYCKEEFLTTRKNQVVCSNKCRDARRSKLEVERQRIRRRQIKSIEV